MNEKRPPKRAKATKQKISKQSRAAIREAEALRESEGRFRTLADNAPVLIWVSNPTGCEFVNQAYLEFLGVSEAEVLGDKWAEFVHPEDREDYVNTYHEAVSRRGRFEAEFRFRRRDGEYRWMQTAGMPRFEGGEFKGYVGSSFEIHERKLAEAALRQSEERFRRLLDTLPVGAYTCDAEGLITYFNERAVEAWGRTPKLNDPVERFCSSYRLYSSDGAQIPHDQCWMALAIEENKAYEGREIVIERPDGSRLSVLAHVNPFYNEAGKLLGAVNIVVEITDRKQAEAVMAQMAAIVESSDDAIIGKDLDGIITSWNEGAERLFGYTAAEVIGKPVTILIPPGRLNEEPYILEHLRRGERVDHYETVRRRKDSSEFDISLTVSPVRDKSGKVIGASKIARDISSRKEAEERLKEALAGEREARGEAERANRSKDEFIALISHELRSPINAILGWTHVLRENRHDEQLFDRSTEIIERNARTQLRLIEDLLDAASVISGKLMLEVRPTDLAEVIEKAEEVVRQAARAKDISLDTRLDRNVGQITGDPDRLQQVVWNLLSNAVKFTNEGGRVEVRLERIDPYVQIVVRDTGRGIKPEFLPYVFDRYRQAAPSGRRRSGGLGLGLSLTRQLVEMHGGSVAAESEGEGKGATFTVRLPVRAVYTAETEGASPASGRRGPLAGVWAVVVDDNADACVLVTKVLELSGARVSAFSSTCEAIELLMDDTGLRPDILISDLSMPGEDGINLIGKLREWERTRGHGAMPAVALSAFGRPQDRKRALESGFQTHVAKPAEPDELVILVESLIENGLRSDNNTGKRGELVGSHDAPG